MKKIVCILLAITLALGLAGCGAKDKKGGSDSSTTNSATMRKSPEKVSQGFIEALLSQNYELALDIFSLPETSLLRADDVQWYLPKSSFADVDNFAGKEYDISTEISSKNSLFNNVVVTITSKEDKEEKSFAIRAFVDKQGDWAVDGAEFYYDNFSFIAPGGNTEVYVNDIKIPEDMCVDVLGNGAKQYNISSLGKNDAVICVKSENFDYSKTVAVESDNEIGTEEQIYPPLKAQNTALSSIISTWNSAYSEFIGGCKESDFQKYISSSADTNICTTMYNGYKGLTKNHSNLSDDKYEKFLLTQCLPATNNEAYWVTDSICYVKFNYEITWHYVLANWDQNTRVADADMYLNYEDGKYKIQVLSTPDMFESVNYYTNEWK